jgi:hypothetical protein
MTRIFAGVDLSQGGLGLVAASPDAVSRLDWGAVHYVTIGESLPKDASPEQRANRLVKLRRAAMLWLAARQVTDVVFEAYPMGSGSLHGIDLVAEMGGALRERLFDELGIAATAAPIASARKLLLGSLRRSHLVWCSRDMKPTEVRRLGQQKAAVVGELRRMGCPFETPDECDAFVALNWGLYQAELPCLSVTPGR